MNLINAPLRLLFDGLLWPFRSLPPLVGLAVISAVIGVLMLLIFKATSNQKRLDAVKRQIHAGLFEIRLYNDDLRAMLRATVDILGSNMRYLGLTVVPLLFMMVPIFLVVAQLQFHYGYEGLNAGDETLLTVKLDESWDSDPARVAVERTRRPALELDVPAALEVTGEGVWIPALPEEDGESDDNSRTMTWRLKAVGGPGEYEIGVKLGDEAVIKTASISDRVTRRSPLKGSGFLDQLIYPAEAPVPSASGIESIELAYPEGSVGLLGWSTHWIIAFFILTLIFAFALRKPLGVTI